MSPTEDVQILERRCRLLLASADTDIRRLISTTGFTMALEGSASDDWQITLIRENIVAHPKGLETPKVILSGRSQGNVIISSSVTKPPQPVVIDGNDNFVHIGQTQKFQARIGITGNSHLFFSGENATCNGANFVLTGEGQSIVIGDDSMFSFEISVRASDSHGIFDLASLNVINQPCSIVFAPHVWISEGVSVLKGVKIGAGSIIGARSLVVSDIPPNSLAVGVPSRVTRQGVSWTREGAPSAEKMAATKRKLERYVDDASARTASDTTE